MHPSIDVGHLHRSLKYVFQKGAIPPWLRDCIPLCSLDDRLVAIGDWCFDKHFENWLTQRKLSLEWQPAHPLLKYIRARQRNAAVDPSGGVR